MRTIKVDQSICNKFEEQLKHSSAAQIGLLLGSVGKDTRDSILSVVATPSFEEGQQPIDVSGVSTSTSKKGKAPKTSPEPHVQVKADWIIEHASQVAPLIPGGLGIAGLFICGPDACFSAAMAKLCAVVGSLRSTGVIAGDAALLTVAAPSGKLSARELPASASTVAALKNCDCRSAPVLSSYLTVRAMHGLGAACTVTSTQEPLRAALTRTVRAEKDSVHTAVVALEALRVPDAGTPVAELCSQAVDTLDAELLTLPACSCAPGQQGKQAQGRTALHGAIAGRALVHKRDTWGMAAAALKADLVRSLDVRLSVLLTDAEEADAGEEESNSPLALQGDAAFGAPQSCCLPERAFLPAEAPMLFSEYCLYGRDVPQVLSTAHEVLGMTDFTEAQVEWPEQSASQQTPGLSWDPLAVQAEPAAHMADASQKAAPVALNDAVCMLMGVGGAAALAVAVGTAWLYMASW